jgi:plastocyanin
MAFPNILFGNEGEQFNSYTTQRWPLGTQMVLQDGRRYRFGRNGAGAATAGLLFQSEVPDGNFDTLSVPAAAATYNTAGTRALRVTLPASAITKDLWAEGYAVTEAAAGAGEGYAYKVKTHPLSAGSEDVTFTLETELKHTLNTSDKVTFVKNAGADVIIHPAPRTANLFGVAAGAIAAASFGWFAVGGPSPVLVVGTHVIGGGLIATGTVTGSPDGSVEASGVGITTTAATIAQITEITGSYVGNCMEVAPTTGYGLAMLNMA